MKTLLAIVATFIIAGAILRHNSIMEATAKRQATAAETTANILLDEQFAKQQAKFTRLRAEVNAARAELLK